MIKEQFSRTKLLLGDAAIRLLQSKRIAVFGIGGVGGYAVEVFARSGIGELHLIDNDQVTESNLNRQIIALHSNIGEDKVDVAEKRILEINPDCKVVKYKRFYLPGNSEDINLSTFDYVVDCIDTITAKIDLAKKCYELNIPIISSMGAANKLNPIGFKVADINKTIVDPLAKVIRKKLRQLGIPKLKVVYSEEKPLKPLQHPENNCEKKAIPASIAYVPAAAGIIIGGEVINDILKTSNLFRQ